MRMVPLTVVIAGTVLWGGPGIAQDVAGPECGSFTLTHTPDSITFVDLGAEGKSPGDKRVIKGTLTGKDGNKVGSLYVIATLMPKPEPEGEDLIFAHLIEELPNGTIGSVALTPLSDAEDVSRIVDKPVHRAVTGGTGAFAHATGMITATTRDDGTRELSYELTCD